MNKLRVEKKSLYEIEVNDNGDVIAFNIEDPTLPLRAEKALEEINRISDKCQAELLLINKKVNKKSKGAVMSDNDRSTLQTYNKTYNDMRKAMDKFLGDGACQKIFGDSNYLTMYDELFDALKPHFEKIGMNANSFVKSIEEKYADVEEDVLE